MNKTFTGAEFGSHAETAPSDRYVVVSRLFRDDFAPETAEDASSLEVTQKLPFVIKQEQRDLHPGVYEVSLVFWALFLVVFWVTFVVSGSALLMTAVGALYAIIYFGVPILMSRMIPGLNRCHSTVKNFVHGRFETAYGPLSGFDALLQVVMVPLSLSGAALVICLAICVVKLAH